MMASLYRSVFGSIALFLATLALSSAYASEPNRELEEKFGKVWAHFAHPSEEGMLATENDIKVAYAIFRVPANRGAILIIPGFSENYSKYAEAIYDFNQRGYSVYISDLRGMGASTRLDSNPQKVHIEDFKSYSLDVTQFALNFIAKDPSPNRYLYSHSTGGMVAMRVLNQLPGFFRAATLGSPLFALNTGKIPGWVATSVTSTEAFVGFGNSFTHGRGPVDLNKKTYAENHDAREEFRFEQNRQYLLKKGNERLWQGGPTNDWVREVNRETENLPALALNIATPVLLLQAGQDNYVLTPPQNRICSLIGDCQVQRFEEAFHSLLLDKDVVRNEVLKQTDEFFQNHAGLSVSEAKLPVRPDLTPEMVQGLSRLLDGKRVGNAISIASRSSHNELTLTLKQLVAPEKEVSLEWKGNSSKKQIAGADFFDSIRVQESAGSTVIDMMTFAPAYEDVTKRRLGTAFLKRTRNEFVGLERNSVRIVVRADGQVVMAHWRKQVGKLKGSSFGYSPFSSWATVDTITARSLPLPERGVFDPNGRADDPQLLLSFQAKGINIGWDTGITHVLANRLAIDPKLVAFSGNSGGALPATFFACHGLTPAAVKAWAKVYSSIDRKLVQDGSDPVSKGINLVWYSKDGKHHAPEHTTMTETVNNVIKGCDVSKMQPLLITANNLEVTLRNLKKTAVHAFTGDGLDQHSYEVVSKGKAQKTCTYFVNEKAKDLILRSNGIWSEQKIRRSLFCDIRTITSAKDLVLTIMASIAEPTYFTPITDPEPARIETWDGSNVAKRIYNGGFGQFNIAHPFKRVLPNLRAVGTGRPRFDPNTSWAISTYYRLSQDFSVSQSNWWFDMNIDQSKAQYDGLYKNEANAFHFKTGCEQMIACVSADYCAPNYVGYPRVTTDIYGQQVKRMQSLSGILRKIPQDPAECNFPPGEAH